MFQIRYLRFDFKLKFEVDSNIYFYILGYEPLNGLFHTVINVDIKDS